jgi:hypothetical protein
MLIPTTYQRTLGGERVILLGTCRFFIRWRNPHQYKKNLEATDFGDTQFGVGGENVRNGEEGDTIFGK